MPRKSKSSRSRTSSASSRRKREVIDVSKVSDEKYKPSPRRKHDNRYVETVEESDGSSCAESTYAREYDDWENANSMEDDSGSTGSSYETNSRDSDDSEFYESDTYAEAEQEVSDDGDSEIVDDLGMKDYDLLTLDSNPFFGSWLDNTCGWFDRQTSCLVPQQEASLLRECKMATTMPRIKRIESIANESRKRRYERKLVTNQTIDEHESVSVVESQSIGEYTNHTDDHTHTDAPYEGRSKQKSSSKSSDVPPTNDPKTESKGEKMFEPSEADDLDNVVLTDKPKKASKSKKAAKSEEDAKKNEKKKATKEHTQDLTVETDVLTNATPRSHKSRRSRRSQKPRRSTLARLGLDVVSVPSDAEGSGQESVGAATAPPFVYAVDETVNEALGIPAQSEAHGKSKSPVKQLENLTTQDHKSIENDPVSVDERATRNDHHASDGKIHGHSTENEIFVVEQKSSAVDRDEHTQAMLEENQEPSDQNAQNLEDQNAQNLEECEDIMSTCTSASKKQKRKKNERDASNRNETPPEGKDGATRRADKKALQKKKKSRRKGLDSVRSERSAFVASPTSPAHEVTRSPDGLDIMDLTHLGSNEDAVQILSTASKTLTDRSPATSPRRKDVSSVDVIELLQNDNDVSGAPRVASPRRSPSLHSRRSSPRHERRVRQEPEALFIPKLAIEDEAASRTLWDEEAAKLARVSPRTETVAQDGVYLGGTQPRPEKEEHKTKEQSRVNEIQKRDQGQADHTQQDIVSDDQRHRRRRDVSKRRHRSRSKSQSRRAKNEGHAIHDLADMSPLQNESEGEVQESRSHDMAWHSDGHGALKNTRSRDSAWQDPDGELMHSSQFEATGHESGRSLDPPNHVDPRRSPDKISLELRQRAMAARNADHIDSMNVPSGEREVGGKERNHRMLAHESREMNLDEGDIESRRSRRRSRSRDPGVLNSSGHHHTRNEMDGDLGATSPSAGSGSRHPNGILKVHSRNPRESQDDRQDASNSKRRSRSLGRNMLEKKSSQHEPDASKTRRKSKSRDLRYMTADPSTGEARSRDLRMSKSATEELVARSTGKSDLRDPVERGSDYGLHQSKSYDFREHRRVAREFRDDTPTNQDIYDSFNDMSAYQHAFNQSGPRKSKSDPPDFREQIAQYYATHPPVNDNYSMRKSRSREMHDSKYDYPEHGSRQTLSQHIRDASSSKQRVPSKSASIRDAIQRDDPVAWDGNGDVQMRDDRDGRERNDNDDRSRMRQRRSNRINDQASDLKKLEKRLEKQLNQTRQTWEERSQASVELRHIEKQLAKKLKRAEEKRTSRLKRLRKKTESRHSSVRQDLASAKTSISDSVRSQVDPTSSKAIKESDETGQSVRSRFTNSSRLRRGRADPRGAAPRPENYLHG